MENILKPVKKEGRGDVVQGGNSTSRRPSITPLTKPNLLSLQITPATRAYIFLVAITGKHN